MNSNRDFLRSDELTEVSPLRVGAKARELAHAEKSGFVVPPFVAIPTEVCATLLTEHERISKVAIDVRTALAAVSFAVRSCALSEDTREASQAGLFKTVLDVSGDDLVSAIRDVLTDAVEKLGGSLHNFSLIIQEFIEPDYAGVLFTRDPRGRRELVVEIAKGRGEKVVDGRHQSQLIRFPWSAEPMSALRLFSVLATEVENLKEFERAKEWPQDVEWCVRGDQFYFLQGRPITSISKKQYREILALEALLPTSGFFLYEKSAVTEIAARPLPLGLSILQWLARGDGPVAKVYRKHGIRYAATNSFRQIGIDLYVDREAELQSLLPAAWFDRAKLKPRIRLGRGWFLTMRNILRLSVLASRANRTTREHLQRALQEKLSARLETSDFESALNEFDRCYEIVFEVNLLCGIALRNAENVLKNEPLAMTTLLESSAVFENENSEFEELTFGEPGLRGNGVDIADESLFVKKSPSSRTSVEAAKWWATRSPLRRKILNEPMRRLVEFTRLREGGRWLTVRHIDHLRRLAKIQAQRAGFKEERSVFGSHLDELVFRKLDEGICVKRLDRLQVFTEMSFPLRLSSVLGDAPGRLIGVSSGRATGRLVTLEQLETSDQPVILFSDSLTPNLAQHFPKIHGIVSRHGGLLSHLAILAREAQIPVVVGFEPSQEIEIGSNVAIDGDLGEIKLAMND